MTVGWLEVVLGVVGGEHWRAVLLVVRGKWTCNNKHWLEKKKLKGQEQGLTRRDLWTRTHGGAGDGFTGSLYGPRCAVAGR